MKLKMMKSKLLGMPLIFLSCLLPLCAPVEIGNPEDDIKLASASFDMEPVASSLVSSSLGEGLDVKSGAKNVVSETPNSFKIPVYQVLLFDVNNDSVELADRGGEYIELVQPTEQVESVLQARDVKIPEGTYTHLSIMLDPSDGSGFPGVLVKSCGTISATEYCTKSSFAENAAGGPAEEVNLDIFVEFQAVFPDRLEVKEGDEVELRLLYDVENVIEFDDTGAAESRTYADGVGINFRSPPTFAFFGPQPAVEIYDLEISESDTGQFPVLTDWITEPEKWTLRIWAFFNDEGRPLAMQNMFFNTEETSKASLNFTMGGDAKLEQREDGTYHLQQGDNFTDAEEVEIWEFIREDHDGEILFYEQSFWEANGQNSGPKAFNYSATKVE